MSKSPNIERKTDKRGPWVEVGCYFAGLAIVGGEFALISASTSSTHRESVVVEGNAPVPATEHRLGDTFPVTLEPGKAMVAECRWPDSGQVDVKEDRAPMLYEIPPEYTMSPDHLRSVLNPSKTNAEWVGSLAICGQQQ